MYACTNRLRRGALLLMATLITGSGQPLPKQDSDYTPAAQSQVVSWQLKRLPPPSQLYVGVDDVLRVAAASSQTGEVVTVNYRLLRAADGKVVVGQFTVAPGSNRAIVVKDNSLAEGFLLSASCMAAVATTRGQTFARLLLNPKALGSGQPAQMLMADYVTTAMAPGFPNGRVLGPMEGPGFTHAVTIPNPAAGADWSVLVPQNAVWRPLAWAMTLNTGAAAGSRTVALALVDGVLSATVYFGGAANSQPANGVVAYSGGRNAPLFTAASVFGANVAMPDVILRGRVGPPAQQDTIETVTGGLLAGDTWTGGALLVEEWLDNV